MTDTPPTVTIALSALGTGELMKLMEVMAPDVVLIADGGGVVPAVLAPLHGAEAVAGLFARAAARAATLETTTVWLNGAAAGLIEVDGELAATSLVVRDGRIVRIYAMRNPGKLTRLEKRTALTR